MVSSQKSAEAKDVAAQAAPADPGFASALSSVAAHASTTTTSPYAAPQSGWVGFDDPKGAFHGNFPSTPAVNGTQATGAASYKAGSVNAGYVGMSDFGQSVIVSAEKAEAQQAGQVLSQKSGSVYGVTYYDFIIKQGSNSYAALRTFDYNDNLYSLSVTGSSQASLTAPFALLTNGFQPLPINK